MDIIKKFGSLIICSLGLLSLTNGQQVTITPGEKSVKKFVNESYFVSCQTSDGSNRADWFNPRNQKVDKSIHSRIRVETDYGVELFLTRITTQDAGVYTCTEKKGGKASFNLTVIRPIVFDTSLEEQSAAEGSQYKMKCVAQGHSQPKIFWKVDNRTPNPPKYKIMKDGLLIHNVSQQDAKVNYVCRAMDMDSPMPDAKLMNITLKVKMKPRLVGNSKAEHWGVMGEWANLTCAVLAEPPPSFEWTHRNRTLTPSDEVFIVNEDNVSILQVLVRNEGKFGVYTCKARNDLGVLERNLHLYKGQKPPAPVLEPEVVGHDAAKIRVKQMRNGADRTPDPAAEEEGKKGKVLPLTGYVVQYKMATRGDWITANVTRYDGGFVLKGLTPQITYHVRAASKNIASVGDFSAPIRIITPKSSPWNITGRAAILHLDYMQSILVVALNVVFLHIVILL